MECFNFMGNILGKLCSTTKQNVTNVYIDNDNNDGDKSSQYSNCTEVDFSSCHLSDDSKKQNNDEKTNKLNNFEIDILPIDNGFKIVFDRF